jgi:hypothetical protein
MATAVRWAAGADPPTGARPACALSWGPLGRPVRRPRVSAAAGQAIPATSATSVRMAGVSAPGAAARHVWSGFPALLKMSQFFKNQKAPFNLRFINIYC